MAVTGDHAPMTHETWVGLAASYALGALDADERAGFESHLAACAVCRKEVVSFRKVIAALAQAVPGAVPLDVRALRARVLGFAGTVRPITSWPRRRGSSVLRWALVAASLALAGFSAIGYWSQRNRVDTLEAAIVAARSDALAADSLIGVLAGPEVHVVSLAQDGGKPVARVFWNHTRNVVVVTAFELAPPPTGRTYQIWAIAQGKAPMSMGTFSTDANGRATAVLPVDAAVSEAGTIDYCGVTLEPEGGSAQPTESPRLLGAWRHVD